MKFVAAAALWCFLWYNLGKKHGREDLLKEQHQDAREAADENREILDLLKEQENNDDAE